ncbi:MAG: type II toxin-antitoxin system VapC family toxin [Rhodoferax sp.]
MIERQGDELRIRPAQRRIGDVVISAITMAELEYGVACSGAAELANRVQLDSFVEDVPVAPFEAFAARAYGPARFANRDCSRDALDKLIASHAIALGVTLVTNHESDFMTYPGLKVENWVSSH